MGSIIHSPDMVLFKTKAAAFETNLLNNLQTCKELIIEAEHIQNYLEACETELETRKQKCERKLCCSSKMYEKIVQSKNNIIQLAVSTAIRIDETKNLNLISELLKILCGEIETLTPPTPPKESQENKENISKNVLTTPIKTKPHTETKSNSPVKKKKGNTPKKKLDSSMEDISFKDDSVSEIEGTPGRTSPIIQTKKLRSSSSVSLSGSSTDSRDKKKCPENWDIPEAKQIKLFFTSPKKLGKGKGKTLRQGRLSIVACKSSSVVDLTCSPVFGGSTNQSQGDSQANVASQNSHVQLLLKKEPSENDDTILPSPTSEPGNIVLSRTTSKDSKVFKKPLSLIKVKTEAVEEANSPIIQYVDKKSKNTTKEDELENFEESINILKTNRFAKSPHKAIKSEKSPIEIKLSPKEVSNKDPAANDVNRSPVKMGTVKADPTPMEEDVTHCEEASMSILQHVNKLEQDQKSPPGKRPLAENQNVVNMSTEESMSLLPKDTGSTKAPEENHKIKVLENVEPVYKEPTARKKAEKLALPGWCCDECKAFFGNLYADDPDKIKAVINRCSKHRGKNNPIRPKTPPGFWYPRWDVPENTEEFNRRNNAD